MIFSRFKQYVDSSVMKQISKLASDMVEDARENASWSDRIPEAITLGNVTKDEDGTARITVTVDLKKAPHALAFEYGSGVHGESGKTYRIEPKNATALKFPESKWPQFEPPMIPGKKMVGLFGNIFVLRYVDHPGVEARPFLTPAIASARRNARSFFFGIISKAYRDVSVDIEVIK